MLRCRVGRYPHRNIIDNHTNFRLHIDAGIRVGDRYGAGRPQETVADRLVHERLLTKLGRQLGAASFAKQFDVVEIGAAIDKLVGSWQRRFERFGVVIT